MEFLVESNEDSICPICGAPLTARDHRKRVWKKERGEKSWVMIRRLVKLRYGVPKCRLQIRKQIMLGNQILIIVYGKDL